MHCVKHKNIIAQGFCLSCGKPYCEECLVNYNGEYHCRYCLSNNESVNKELSSQQEFDSIVDSTKKTENKKNKTAMRILFIIVSVLILRPFILALDNNTSGLEKPGYSKEHYDKMQALAELEYEKQAQEEKRAQEEKQAQEESQVSEPVNDQLNGFIVVDEDSYADDYSRYITGKIVNNKNYTLRYMQVTYNLYDINKNLVGTGIDNIRNVGPGETWSFKVGIFDDSVNFMRVTEIIGY